MPRRAPVSSLLLLSAALVATGCQTTPEPRPEPIVRVVERNVPQPVPCPALAELTATLHASPYPDTDEALRSAPNIAVRSRLLMTGRELRDQHLREYEAAAAACDF